jgi:hypothetical protein
MYQTYSITRTFDADDMRAQTFAVSDDDAINCAHMLAAGFNTMSRNHMLSFVMAVVDTETGIVQYNGKTEQIHRPEPWSTSHTFTFNPTAGDADTILTLFGNGETPTFTAAGKLSFSEPSKYAHINRDVLEEAYAELQDVKNVLFDAGVETIPADAGVRALLDMCRERGVEIAEFKQREVNRTAAARDELIEFTRGAYEKLRKVDPAGYREDLQNRYRGMLDVLANLLVAIGEADRDERHAVARRLVEKSED